MFRKELPMNTYKKATLCWDCKKSTNSGCSWSENFIPVKGWEVEKSVGMHYDSFCVLACPEFVRDSFDGGTQRIHGRPARQPLTDKRWCPITKAQRAYIRHIAETTGVDEPDFDEMTRIKADRWIEAHMHLLLKGTGK